MRPKARYAGDGAGTLVQGFDSSIHNRLRDLLPKRPDDGARQFAEGFKDQDWRQADPRDGVVQELLTIAHAAKVELHRINHLPQKKGDLRTEQRDLIGALNLASMKLRSVSIELERLFGPDPLPADVADAIDKMVTNIQSAGQRVADLPSRQKKRVSEHRIAKELSDRVIGVFEREEIPTVAWVAADDGSSTLIRVLKMMGDACGLERAPRTWRRTAQEAKQTR